MAAAGAIGCLTLITGYYVSKAPPAASTTATVQSSVHDLSVPTANPSTVHHDSTSLVRDAPESQTIVGRASVIDGDTIEIGGERIRFNGVDAPETRQMCADKSAIQYRCGSESAQFLDEFLASSRPTRCEFVDRDRYGRFVGNCFRADGTSVAESLVFEGHALDWEKYSHGAYRKQQEAAKAARRGLWRGTFQNPWDYRADKRG